MRKKFSLFVCVLVVLFLGNLSVLGESSGVYNNGGFYVKHNDTIYYREYSLDSYGKTATWGEFPLLAGSQSKLMALEADQARELICDYGYGRIFLYEDSQGNHRFLLTGLDPEDNEGIVVYSLDSEGQDRRDYSSGTVFALDEERSLAIISGYRGSLLILDLNTEETDFCLEAYYSPLYYDQNEGILYGLDDSGYGDSLIEIVALNVLTGSEANSFSISSADLGDLTESGRWGWSAEIGNAFASGDYFYLYLAYYEGTGNFYADSILLKINKDGKSYEAVADPQEVDWFGLEKPFCLSFDGPYFSSEAGYFIYPEKSLERQLVLSRADLEPLGLLGGEYMDEWEVVWLRDLEYVGENLFFTVLTGIRNKEEEWGWKWVYDLLEARTYYKDLKTGQLFFLYGSGGLVRGNVAEYEEYLNSLDLAYPGSIRKGLQTFMLLEAEWSEEEKEQAFLAFSDFYENVATEVSFYVWEPEMARKFYEAVSDEQGYLSYALLELLNDPDSEPDDYDVASYARQILQNGLQFGTAEGSIYVETRPDFLTKTFAPYLSGAYGEYFALLQKEALEGFMEDAMLVISYQKLAERIITWENFLENYPDVLARENVLDLIDWYLWVFLQGVDNSPIFSWDDGLLKPEVKEAYEWFSLENPERPSGILVRKFYGLLEEEDFQETKRIRDFWRDNLY